MILFIDICLSQMCMSMLYHGVIVHAHGTHVHVCPTFMCVCHILHAACHAHVTHLYTLATYLLYTCYISYVPHLTCHILPATPLTCHILRATSYVPPHVLVTYLLYACHMRTPQTICMPHATSTLQLTPSHRYNPYSYPIHVVMHGAPFGSPIAG